MASISNIWKQLTSILSSLNNFHSLEVVDRVSETQLQVGENSDWISWRLKGWEQASLCAFWYVYNAEPKYYNCLLASHSNKTHCQLIDSRQNINFTMFSAFYESFIIYFKQMVIAFYDPFLFNPLVIYCYTYYTGLQAGHAQLWR